MVFPDNIIRAVYEFPKQFGPYKWFIGYHYTGKIDFIWLLNHHSY